MFVGFIEGDVLYNPFDLTEKNGNATSGRKCEAKSFKAYDIEVMILDRVVFRPGQNHAHSSQLPRPIS